MRTPGDSTSSAPSMVSVCPPAPAGWLSAMRTSSPGQGRHSAMRARVGVGALNRRDPARTSRARSGPRSSSQVSARTRADAGSARRRRRRRDSVSVDCQLISSASGPRLTLTAALAFVDAHAGRGDRLAGQQRHVDARPARRRASRAEPPSRPPTSGPGAACADAQERRQRDGRAGSSGGRPAPAPGSRSARDSFRLSSTAPSSCSPSSVQPRPCAVTNRGLSGSAIWTLSRAGSGPVISTRNVPAGNASHSVPSSVRASGGADLPSTRTVGRDPVLEVSGQRDRRARGGRRLQHQMQLAGRRLERHPVDGAAVGRAGAAAPAERCFSCSSDLRRRHRRLRRARQRAATPQQDQQPARRLRPRAEQRPRRLPPAAAGASAGAGSSSASAISSAARASDSSQVHQAAAPATVAAPGPGAPAR